MRRNLEPPGTMRDMEPGNARHRPGNGSGVDLAMDRLRRGAIESCVLALLRGGAAYSYDVVTALAGVDGMVTSEGTLYPLLGRLRREGLVETRWQESPHGPPRRYYALTPEGERAVDAFEAAWAIFRCGVDSIVEGHVRAGDPTTPSLEETP